MWHFLTASLDNYSEMTFAKLTRELKLLVFKMIIVISSYYSNVILMMSVKKN